MEEMYVLHELGDIFYETEASQEEAPEEPRSEPQEEAPQVETIETELVEEPEPTGHSLVFVPIEEPGPNWEMELAQAYVRAQPLEGVFSPEEGLRMGTAFPNLSQPYSGRE